MYKYIFSILLTCLVLEANEVCVRSCTCESGPCIGTASLRHREANGIGYSTGYTSLDLFYTPSTSHPTHLFFDLRAHVFNDRRPAFNTGIGLRLLPKCQKVIYGINAYWDYRQANHSAFHQAAIGLELLWPRFDLRLNGYAPFNRHKKGYQNAFSHFKGNYAYFYRKYELAMWGGDLSLGSWIYQGKTISLYTGLDGYYFQGDYGKHAGGGLFRTKIHSSDYVTLEGQVSYDSLFKWIGQGEIALHLPFGGSIKRKKKHVRSCKELINLEKQLTERPNRFEIIVTSTHKSYGRALDPVTGNPLKFIFVDNTSSSLGTYESPYPTLAEAMAAATIGDAIYIFPGDGTSTGLNTVTILQDRQWLIGSGDPILMQTRFGNLFIPELTTEMPILTIPGSNAITIANQNTISGIKIVATSGNAVVTNGTATDFTLTNSILLAEKATGGIGLNVQLNGLNNRITDNDLIFGNQIAGVGIIFVGNSVANVNFSRNTITGTSGPETGFGLIIQPYDSSVSNVIVEDNVINCQPGSQQTALFVIARGGPTVTTSIRNNQVNTYTTSDAVGIGLLAENTSTIIANVQNNIVNVEKDSIGIAASSINTATIYLHLAKNQSSAPDSTQSTISGLFSPLLTNDFSIGQTGSAKIYIQSPNGHLTGVQNMNNQGNFSSIGTPQFIPLQ